MKKGHYNNIKGVLGTLGVKSDELAEGLKVNPTTVSRWCTNDSQPSLERLYEIAEFLGVPTTDLIFPTLPPTSTRKK